MSEIEIVFDLDDTLYRERDYARSALSFAGNLGEKLFGIQDATVKLLSLSDAGDSNPIGTLWNEECLPPGAKDEVIAAMRAHTPSISLAEGASNILGYLRYTEKGFSIVTDGRSITQRAKIAALGCLDARMISISEEVGLAKTDPERFRQVERNSSAKKFVYVGDNPRKDFVAPNKLGWDTVMIKDDGRHIHKQEGENLAGYAAKFVITDLIEIRKFL